MAIYTSHNMAACSLATVLSNSVIPPFTVGVLSTHSC